jgi:regulatory protein
VSASRKSRAERAAPDDEARLYSRALRLLAAHDRTAVDLRRRLERHGEPGTVTRVLARLEGQGYLDDRRFAQAWTEREAIERGAGARLVRAGLRAHGVGEAIVAEAVARAGDAEAQTALALARKAAARMGGLPAATRVRRLAAQLARRGYRPAVVYQAVRAALADARLGEAGENALEGLAAADDTAGPDTGAEDEPGG